MEYVVIVIPNIRLKYEISIETERNTVFVFLYNTGYQFGFPEDLYAMWFGLVFCPRGAHISI